MTANSKTNMETDAEEILLRPILHITKPGPENRNIFRQFCLSYNFWIKCPKDRQKIYSYIGGTLHNLALLVDDMEDATVSRRGIPAAHVVYGTFLTIRSTIYMAFLLHQKIQNIVKERKDSVTHEFIKLGLRLFTGQGLEIYYRDNMICPTFDDYRTLLRGKSAGCLIYGVRLLEQLAEIKKIEFSFGMFDKMSDFLQIYNDYLNLRSTKYSAVHQYCSDLDEGKFNFPIIHAIQTHPEDHRLLDMLKRRPLDVESKKLFVDIMESFGSFEYTRNVLEDLKKGIFDDVVKMKLERHTELEQYIQDILNHLETEIYYDGCDEN